MGDRHRTLEAAPIVAAVEARGGIAVVLGLEQPGDRYGPDANRPTLNRHKTDRDVQRWSREFYRMRSTQVVSPAMADRFCMAVLDVQPELLYGPDWWAGADELDDVAAAWLAGDLPLVLDGGAA